MSIARVAVSTVLASSQAIGSAGSSAAVSSRANSLTQGSTSSSLIARDLVHVDPGGREPAPV